MSKLDFIFFTLLKRLMNNLKIILLKKFEIIKKIKFIYIKRNFIIKHYISKILTLKFKI